jgi:DNA-directed RNA polymerase III subunit RPC8
MIGGGEENKSPYILNATMQDSGLGPCLWWDGGEREDEEEEAMGEM